MTTSTLNQILLACATPLPSYASAGQTQLEHLDALTEALREALDGAASRTYSPAIDAVHSGSRGMAQRILSSTTGRDHHLLSRHERALFLLAEFDPSITDIREQFEIPIELSTELSLVADIDHPWYDDSPSALTTDFLLSRNGKWVAVDFKMRKDLHTLAQQKLTLAGLAFELVGVPHHIVTEEFIPKQVVQNLRWLHVHRLTAGYSPFRPDLIDEIEGRLRVNLSRSGTTAYEAACRVASEIGLPASSVSRMCFWFIANRWNVDLTRPIGPDYPIIFN